MPDFSKEGATTSGNAEKLAKRFVVMRPACVQKGFAIAISGNDATDIKGLVCLCVL